MTLPESSHGKATGVVTGRKRKRYEGSEKMIPPFHSNLKQAQFKLTPCDDLLENVKTKVQQEKLDFVWLLQSFTRKLSLFTGFFSQFVTDYLPETTVTYMDPISQPPSRNDAVRETMVRSLTVAEETNQEYAVVTYDLPIAQKAYCIQALQTPTFDNLLILLGNFHLELAYFGAIGTFLADSGVEYLLTEGDVLAEGSVSGFMKGKFYNRCTRIHQLLACVLERALVTKYLESAESTDASFAKQVMSDGECTQDKCQTLAEEPEIESLMERYEKFFHDVIDGKCGGTASYWAIYVYLVNRVYRELQRAVRTNDVQRYIQVLPRVIGVFFALNRPNYARWGSLFLNKLEHMDMKAREILDGGAMSIRRTKKSFARSSVDLTLEQTVNRTAASSSQGITAFRNSQSAFRRWSVTHTQRSMAVAELCDLVHLKDGEDPTNQLRKSRIERYNADMDSLTKTLNGTCNPFGPNSPDDLINISSGKSAKDTTEKFLLGTLERGAHLCLQFQHECETDGSRFLKPVARVRMLNFASENVKTSKTAARKVNAAEGARDAFGRILAVVGATSDAVDLNHILRFPITDVPLALAHSDGTPLKIEKATLTKALERKQETILVDSTLPSIDATVIDGGLLLHETILKHSHSTYATMATDVLVKVCSSPGDEIHLVLDKYTTPSIKDCERNLRDRQANSNQTFVITGPDQAQRQSGKDLLRNVSFKDEFAKFLPQEWQKPRYSSIVGRKTLYVSHGGNCVTLTVNKENKLQAQKLDHYQSRHEFKFKFKFKVTFISFNKWSIQYE